MSDLWEWWIQHNMSSNDNHLSLLAAAANGDLKGIRAAVSSHQGKVSNFIRQKDDQGVTALHLACLSGSLDSVEFLIDNGASINTADNTGIIPLLFAAQKGFVDIVELLIKAGSKMNRTKVSGESALFLGEFVEQASRSIFF
eukprot:TRINITY_DN937_c0_g4_i1.p1 TRINITY_DN937_c0_g4~~TRINITY_DN937_c0_g4_i1.p1  ORF type:complete len:142 (-),score=30.78 TRINITY_DN937_c0_g4_i1:82-507(-)